MTLYSVDIPRCRNSLSPKLFSYYTDYTAACSYKCEKCVARGTRPRAIISSNWHFWHLATFSAEVSLTWRYMYGVPFKEVND